MISNELDPQFMISKDRITETSKFPNLMQYYVKRVFLQTEGRQYSEIFFSIFSLLWKRINRKGWIDHFKRKKKGWQTRGYSQLNAFPSFSLWTGFVRQQFSRCALSCVSLSLSFLLLDCVSRVVGYVLNLCCLQGWRQRL